MYPQNNEIRMETQENTQNNKNAWKGRENDDNQQNILGISRNDAYYADSVAIPSIRNHLYAKASHSGRLHAGHRT